MDTQELDTKMVAAVFAQAGLVGWRDVNLVDAAREAELDPAAVRARFPGKTAVLLRFGSLADQAVLAAAPSTGLPREKLFDLIMARFDVLQQHRDGVLSLMEALRFDPGLTVLLGGATLRSMKWMLEAAGIPAGGIVGALRVQGLGAIWAYALRAWAKDESQDLASVMAAVDRGLDRALQAEGMLPGHSYSEASQTEASVVDPSMDPAVVSAAAVDIAGTEASSQTEVPPIMTGTDILDADNGPAVL